MNYEENDILNLFVSIAPSHNKNFEEMINAGLVKGTNALINVGGYFCNKSSWDLLICGEKNIGNKTGGTLTKFKFQIEKLILYKKFINKVKETLPETKFNLYYCNLEDVLNNYLFFSFRKGLIQERILVEDGILNYYDYKINSKNRTIFIAKKALSFLMGIPYKIVQGQLSGIDLDIVKKQYVRIPSQAIYPNKSIELPQRKIIYNPNNNIILFIGQDILENIIGSERYLSEIELILEKIKKNSTKESILIYKPHRNGDYKSIINLLDRCFENKYKLMLDSVPIESLVEKIKPLQIFSFYSTALLNIQLGLPANTKVKIFSKPIETVTPRVLKIFEDVGIILLR